MFACQKAKTNVHKVHFESEHNFEAKVKEFIKQAQVNVVGVCGIKGERVWRRELKAEFLLRHFSRQRFFVAIRQRLSKRYHQWNRTAAYTTTCVYTCSYSNVCTFGNWNRNYMRRRMSCLKLLFF